MSKQRAVSIIPVAQVQGQQPEFSSKGPIFRELLWRHACSFMRIRKVDKLLHCIAPHCTALHGWCDAAKIVGTARPIALDRPGHGRVGTYSSVVSSGPVCRKDFPWLCCCVPGEHCPVYVRVLEKLGRVHAGTMRVSFDSSHVAKTTSVGCSCQCDLLLDISSSRASLRYEISDMVYYHCTLIEIGHSRALPINLGFLRDMDCVQIECHAKRGPRTPDPRANRSCQKSRISNVPALS
jgi:hypothetical protein